MRSLISMLLALCLALPGAVAEERRLALLIGNEDYPSDLGRLANTHADVAKVAGALSQVGFQVTQTLDANAAEMDAAITAFELAIEQEKRAGHDVIAFFYASMHGARMEVAGRDRNFLVPAKETIGTPGQLVQRGVRLDRLIERFSASGADAFFLVSDACRNDLGRTFSRSSVKGFVPERAGPGMLVAFATSEGATTPDDGLFATTLAAEITKPGRRATVALLDTVERVGLARSLEGQPYFRANRIPEMFCFSGCAAPAVGQLKPERVTVEVPVLANEAGQALAQALSADTFALWQDFAQRFPGHAQIAYARTRIEALTPPPPALQTAIKNAKRPIKGARQMRTLRDADCQDDPKTSWNDCSVNSAAFSPNGLRIVTASSDTTARVWDAATGAELQRLKGHGGSVTSATFSPDGARIVTAALDRTAWVWDAVTGAALQRLKGHEDAVDSAAFSPDGMRVVTASWDQTARVWDAATGAELQRLKGHEGYVVSAAFSPDGSRIVTASVDQTARVWDAATGAELQRLKGHEGYVAFAAFSPDGARIVTASVDQTARVWDAATGAELQRLKGHGGSVTSATFSPDGARIVTASEDSTARVWALEFEGE